MSSNRDRELQRLNMKFDELLTLRETAQRLNVSIDTLRWWRHRHEGPKGFRAGRRVYFRVSDVENWIEERIAAEELGRSHK